MRRGIKVAALGLLLALSMGGTCRTETTQSVLNTFFSAIAQITGEAIGQLVIDRDAP